MDAQTEHLILGPMPVAHFLRDFLPEAPKPRPRQSKTYFNQMPEGVQKSTMHKSFIDLINGSGIIPEFKMANATFQFDEEKTGNGMSRTESVAVMYCAGLCVTKKEPQMAEIEEINEILPSDADDTFDDTPTDEDAFELQTDAGTNICNSLINSATEWFSRQHRRHGFTIFLFGTYARFIPWDCAGAIVSRKFNFRKDSTHLMEFLWRFSHLDDAGRGRDPHVRRATPREANIAQRELDEWKPKDERPAVVFTIKGEDGKDRYFIGWSTISEGYSMTGRCTKAYPVYEEATNQKAFLKDAWRAHNLSPEAEILRELRDAKVEHIPIYMCGGDVEGSVTQTDLYITVEEANNWGVNAAKRDGSWKRGSSWDMVIQRFQHRFVSDVIPKPLDKLENSKHMMLVFSHAFTAHRQAYERCEIIHRDISDNNIMITASGGGILNDWDMAKKKKDINKRWDGVVGTWPFISILLGYQAHFLANIQDDMESFVLVVLYTALRYFDHNQSNSASDIIGRIFPDQVVCNRYFSQKGSREAVFLHHDIITPDFRFSSLPLHRWVFAAIRNVKKWIKHEIRSPDIDDMIASPAESTKQPHGLDSHEGLDDLFSLTLNSTDWPENNTPHDILLEPRIEEKHETLEGGTKEDGGSGEAVRGSQPSVGAQVETSAQLAPSEAHNTRQTLKRRRGREDVGGRGQSGKRRNLKNATNVPGPSRAGAEGGQSKTKVSYKAGGPSRRVDPMKRTRASAAVLAVRNA